MFKEVGQMVDKQVFRGISPTFNLKKKYSSLQQLPLLDVVPCPSSEKQE
jgi:hypothetical protein